MRAGGFPFSASIPLPRSCTTTSTGNSAARAKRPTPSCARPWTNTGSASADQTIVYYAVKYGAQSAWDENAADRKKGYIRVLTDGYENIPLNIDWETYRQQLFDQKAKEPPIDPGKPAYCTLPAKT